MTRTTRVVVECNRDYLELHVEIGRWKKFLISTSAVYYPAGDGFKGRFSSKVSSLRDCHHILYLITS